MQQKVNIIYIYYSIFINIANPELIRANNAKQVFQNRLPLPLREKKPEQQKEEKVVQPQTGAEEESKKEEAKDQANLSKKDEISYDVGSEGEKSDDEHKKVDQSKLDKELNKIIYITITETPTSILFYCPSTKYLNLKNGK